MLAVSAAPRRVLILRNDSAGGRRLAMGGSSKSLIGRDFVVQADLSILHQQHDYGCREHLGDRCYRKPGFTLTSAAANRLRGIPSVSK